ncbi:MAG: cysteine hydrolase family protein, partial [Planctomycetota bacterium]
MKMNPTETAILLVGYQNDFFRADGLLHGAVGEEIQNRNVLPNTLRLLERALFSGVTVVSTPIAFTDDYRELENPVGILKTIKELGAFRKSSPGSRTVDSLQKFHDRIVELPGKQGLCSFSNTGLDSLLQERGIKNVVIAGVVTSVC